MVTHYSDQSSTAIEGVAATTIELLDNGVSLGPVTMTGPTTWSKQVSGLVAGSQHRFLARASGGSPSSNSWDVSIRNKLTGSENFESLPSMNLQPGVRYETSTMTMIFVRGTGTVWIDKTTRQFPGQLEGNLFVVSAANINDPVVARLELKGSCSRISFWHWGNFSWALFVFYNSVGDELERRRVDYPELFTIAEAVFENPDIAVVEIEAHRLPTGQDYVRFDWFRFS